MSAAEDLGSGKGHGAPRHRRLILAFYRVARMADDIADHPTATPQVKLAQLAGIEAALLGENGAVTEASALRRGLEERGMAPTHMLDLLKAFRRDVLKTRTDDWADLMDYCRYSACPVGRFVLDVHGEDPATWTASDALCSALQVINHLQDCGRDYRELDRVYLPMDALAAAGIAVESLGAPHASGALRGVIGGAAARTAELLERAKPLSRIVADARLGLEIGVIRALAMSLNGRLMRRDPLSQRVHHRPIEALGVALLGAGGALVGRLGLGKRRVLRHS